MNQVQIARQNHYVPIWYQKGFIIGPRTTLQYLDLDPQKTELPNGSVIVGEELKLRSPQRCFREKDLYTTRFGRSLNDEVEKFLFGAIDASGATAVNAFVGSDPQMIHGYFQQFFEYLNAQKLRTPKGLDWIKSSYPSLTQVDLMLEMQHLRLELTRFGGHLNCAQEVSGCRRNIGRLRRNTGSRWSSWFAGVARQRSWLGSSSARLGRFATGCGKQIGTRVFARTD